MELIVTENGTFFELIVEPRLYNKILHCGFEWGTYHRETPFGQIITFFFVPTGMTGHLATDFDVLNAGNLEFLKRFSQQSEATVIVRDSQRPYIFTTLQWELETDRQKQLKGFIQKSLMFNLRLKSYNFDRASDYLDYMFDQECLQPSN